MNDLNVEKEVLENIARRAHYLANQMIYVANHRSNVEKGDPKVGGHSSASSSAIHIMGAIHLLMKTGFDHIVNKPHASPADHAYNYLLDLFLHKDLRHFNLKEANTAMHGLRAFPQNGEAVFQSYHSAYDPDYHNFLPTGTVGIPAVNAGYLALAYRFAKEHGYEVPEAHFWCVLGDAEFREGSLFEAIPDFAEREIGNLTWIVDYNRQSLDGQRITNKDIMGGTDDTRIENTLKANGWEVIQVRHGETRWRLFEKPGGQKFQNWLESELPDFELQAMLLVKDTGTLKEHVVAKAPHLKEFVDAVTDKELYEGLHDFGGHDMLALAKAMEQSKEDSRKPTLIIAHTIKGWNLKMAAASGNHSALPSQDEMKQLREVQGLKEDEPFARFDLQSSEGQYCKQRGQELYNDIMAQNELKERNQTLMTQDLQKQGPLPDSLDINLKMASYPHTQWMLGQLSAKLTRIANTPSDEAQLKDKQRPLSEEEKRWKLPAELFVSMAPDVGTSTNLNPAMDGKVFGAEVTEDFEVELHVKDSKTPDLVPNEEFSHRYIRFEIVEANAMSCMGSFGRLRDTLGLPILPMMSVYDFFVKRAHDQYFYDLYWPSSFVLAGTPSGVTLSPEGAQHGWKSDFQIPNQVTWEPFFCQELDWIFCDSLKRHVLNENDERTGVHIRCVTRGVDQKQLTKYLKQQRRFKVGLDESQRLAHKDHPVDGSIDESQVMTFPETQIMEQVKKEVLNGGYFLIDYRGYAGYEPGDNVVHLFAMGSLGTEAIEASEVLLSKGIYANVIVVTSPDLLAGNLAHKDNYSYLRETLGLNADIYLQPQMNGSLRQPEVMTLAGRRIPLVSVHDGEPGLLDNLGSIVGVRHESLAVRKHSRCGRPSDIYAYHGIDAAAIVQAAGKVLSETALEQVQVSSGVLKEVEAAPRLKGDWRQLWSQN